MPPSSLTAITLKPESVRYMSGSSIPPLPVGRSANEYVTPAVR